MRTLHGAIPAYLVAALAASVGAQRVYESDEPGVTLPKPVKQVKAEYPAEARTQRIEGTVVLDVVTSRMERSATVIVCPSVGTS